MYEFSVKDCYTDSKYKVGIIKDSLKANSIFKGQRIWRSIGFDNTENKPFFSGNNKCVQIGLFEIIKFGLIEKKLNAFKTDNFIQPEKNRLTPIQVVSTLKYSDTVQSIIFDSEGAENKSTVIENRYLKNADIKSYLLKEDWYFNSASGKLEKKIVALAPLIYDKKKDMVVPLFWMYYNEWKPLLDLFEMKNSFSDQRISYAYALENQYFISIVSKESNIFGRSVKETNHSSEKTLESEVIKGKISKSETDLYPN